MTDITDINSKPGSKKKYKSTAAGLLKRVEELESLLARVLRKLKYDQSLRDNPDLNTVKLLIDDIENAL